METSGQNLLNEEQLLRASPSIFELTKECFSHFHEDFEAIRTLLHQSNFIELGQLLHKFRGRASMCGFSALAQIASAMEQETLTGQRETDLHRLLDQLMSTHEQTQSAFQIVCEKKTHLTPVAPPLQ